MTLPSIWTATYRRLAVGLEVGEKRYVLQVGVGGVVAGEVADAEATVQNGLGQHRVREPAAGTDVRVIGLNSCMSIDSIGPGGSQCCPRSGSDFYSGQPQYGVDTRGGLQNNIAFTGGLLISVLAIFPENQLGSHQRVD